MNWIPVNWIRALNLKCSERCEEKLQSWVSDELQEKMLSRNSHIDHVWAIREPAVTS